MDKEIFDSLDPAQRMNVGRAINALAQYDSSVAAAEDARLAYNTTLIRLRASGVSIRELAALIDRSPQHVQRHTGDFHDPRYDRVQKAAGRRGTQLRNARRRRRSSVEVA